MIYDKQLTEEEKDFQEGNDRTNLEMIAFSLLIKLSKEKQIQILNKFID